MNAPGRGHAGDIDPADQWVFNPDTGSYELRLDPAAAEPAGPTGGRTGPPGPRREARTTASETRGSPARPRPRTGDGGERVPGQRSRRSEPSGGSRSSRRRTRGGGKTGRKKALVWGSGALAFLLIAGGGVVYWVYQDLNSNIDKVDVGIDNGPTTDGPVNILLIGTDARTGEGNAGYGDNDSVGHADTTLLLHVSKDRSHATALSIPRDLVTDIPECTTKLEDGSEKTIPAEQGVRFNESLGQHGRDPGCTWRAVQELTGLEVNHFMMADFDAVKTLSSAVGGVEVCVAKDIDDEKSHLQLSAGTHVLEGEQALAFVRTRDSVGFGSDLSRIELQQQFLSSMFRKMKSSDTLTSPTKLLDIAQAATQALTVDTGIGEVSKLANLARDLQAVNPSDITFATLPVVDNPNEAVRATVVLDEAKAQPMLRMLQADKSLAEDGKDEKKETEQVADAPASEVRVDVLNGGGPIGAAQSTVTWLQNEESVPLSTNAGNADQEQEQTTLEYGADQADQAATLTEMMGLPESALKKQSQDAGDTPMRLVLGSDFAAPGTPVEAPDKLPDDVQNINGGDKNVCAE